jgi:hypothetical protein
VSSRSSTANMTRRWPRAFTGARSGDRGKPVLSSSVCERPLSRGNENPAAATTARVGPSRPTADDGRDPAPDVRTVSIVIAIAWAVAGVAILYKLATSRGRNPILWGLFGAVAFLIALIVILIAGKSDDYQPRAAS